jgi:hypothetical protein
MNNVVGLLYDKSDGLKSKHDEIVAYSVLGAQR